MCHLLACEPIWPFLYIAGGPGHATKSFSVLAVVVLLKTLLYAYLQKQDRFDTACLRMLMGNVASTIAGLGATLMAAGDEASLLFGLLLCFFLAQKPGSRLKQTVPMFARIPQDIIALMMTLGLGLSCVLFAVLRGSSSGGFFVWSMKVAAIWLGLGISFLLTSLWEEWVVWRLSKHPPAFCGHMHHVLRANLITLSATMIGAAWFVWPQI